MDLSLEAKETEAKINKWDPIKLKGFCTVKETINKIKKTTYRREKIFTNFITDKGLISKICIWTAHTTQYKKTHNPV